jgi:arylsulfatase A-like enzyme
MPMRACVLLAMLLWVSAVEAAQPPNIVFIVADDLGWADVGYHNPQMRTPRIDRLVREGVELDAHYVQPECTPTRVALLSGRYPSRFGRHCTQASNDKALPDGTPTLASLLRAAGYETALVGKWHLGSKPEWGPNHFGFDYSYGCLAGATGMFDHRYRLTRPEFSRTWHRNERYVDEEGHVTDLATREAVAWIEKERQGPFFLYVPFQSVHTPLVEEDRWMEQNRHIEHADRRLFAAAVTHLDDAVGQVVDALERSGQRENTLVVFTSDNGAQEQHAGNAYPAPDPKLTDFSSNEPLRGRKTEVYEGGIRVPAFVSWPSRLKPGIRSMPMHAVDWLPTVLAVVGVDPQATWLLDGLNMWPALAGNVAGGGAAQRERTLYWVWGNRRQRVALRQGPWKMLRPAAEAPLELYNVIDDPYEKVDLAGKMPQKLAELRERLEAERAKDAL